MLLRQNIYFYPSKNGMDFSGEINSNSILITGEQGHMLIDPGILRRFGELKEAIKADGIDFQDIKLVFLTHGHPDHAEASVACRSELGAQVAMGYREIGFLQRHGRIFYKRDVVFDDLPPPPPERAMPEFEIPDKSMLTSVFPGHFAFGGCEFRLFEAPGHSPGGLVLHWPERGLLVLGNNYFPGTIGAFDLPGGSFADMEMTITVLRGVLDVELAVCGHGVHIKGKDAVRRNYVMLFDEIEDKKRKMAAK